MISVLFKVIVKELEVNEVEKDNQGLTDKP